MSDKGKMNFTDKQFADFAWSEMEQILDKEMPVGKKKRIAVWYWLAAGLLFIFTLGALISQPNKNQNLITKATPTENTITNNNSPKLADNNTADLSQKRATLNTQTTLSSTKINSKTQKHTDVSTPNPLIAILAPKATHGIKVAEVDKNQLNELASAQVEAIDNMVILPTSQNRNPSYPISDINTIASQVAYTKTNEPLAFTSHKALSKKLIPSTLSTTLFAKAQTTSFTGVNGYEAGFMVTKNINKSKWSVGVGLSFSSEIVQLDLDTLTLGQHTVYSSSIESADDIGINEAIFFDINNLSALTAATDNSFFDTNLNLQLQYISVPILVSYKLNSRVSMYAGISPSFLIKSKIIFDASYGRNLYFQKEQDFLGANLRQSDNSSIPLENHTLRLTSSVHAPIKIKRFKLPIHLGINYQLAKHFGLTLDATANLQPIVNQDFIKTDFGRFKLGAYWRF